MTLYVLDTDTLVLFQEGHERVCRRVLSQPIEELATTAGWHCWLVPIVSGI